MEGKFIKLSKYVEETCFFCHSDIDLVYFVKAFVCRECAEKLSKEVRIFL